MSIDRRQFMGAVAGAAMAPLLGRAEPMAPLPDAPRPFHAGDDAIEVRSVRRPPTTRRNSHYPTNRAPLLAEHFVKLPVASITPGGWLCRQLELQRDGLTGHLGEISIWLSKQDNAWLNKEGKGKHGWEELPYWLKGYADIGYVLGDAAMIHEAKFWIEAVLENQRDSGDFGPEVFKGQGKRTPSRDLWTNMPMLFCLQSYHEYSQDPARAAPDAAVLRVAAHRARRAVPEGLLGEQPRRRQPGQRLLALQPHGRPVAARSGRRRSTATRRTGASRGSFPTGTTSTSRSVPRAGHLLAAEPRPARPRRDYDDFDLVRELYGQVPGGMFGADEDARPGYDDPRQALETCGMVEQMTSNAMLTAIRATRAWADHTEDVAFNIVARRVHRGLPRLSAISPRRTMVVSDGENHAPGIANDGPFLLMNPFSSRCCQHNHSQGWVYFTEHSWMATPDDGLAALLYGANEVRARVGDGADVRLVADTRYPFEEQVRIAVHTPRAVDFPLYLRVPRWCRAAGLRVNGDRIAVDARPGEYLRIARRWRNGDRVTLDLPMDVGVREMAEEQEQRQCGLRAAHLLARDRRALRAAQQHRDGAGRRALAGGRRRQQVAGVRDPSGVAVELRAAPERRGPATLVHART